MSSEQVQRSGGDESLLEMGLGEKGRQEAEWSDERNREVGLSCSGIWVKRGFPDRGHRQILPSLRTNLPLLALQRDLEGTSETCPSGPLFSLRANTSVF